MRKIKKYYICDRCKKEINEEEINKVFDNYFYDLCNKCKKIYDEYSKRVEGLKKSWEELEKKV